MILQYKTHIWGITEHHNGSIRHASETALMKLDRLQMSFVAALHLMEKTAFLDRNFAPPCLRRDIGLLGFLHKRVLGQCHPAIMQIFPMAPGMGWHDKTLDCFMEGCIFRHALHSRSIFGLISVYNRLPQDLVDLTSVTAFQKELTKIARDRCANNMDDWHHSFHNCSRLWQWRIAYQPRFVQPNL